MVKPRNPEKSPEEVQANAQAGYGPNNPEPARFKGAGEKKGKKPLP